MSEIRPDRFSSLVQSDSQLRERVRQAPSPQHVVDLASSQGHTFTQATLMKMQADKIRHFTTTISMGPTAGAPCCSVSVYTIKTTPSNR